LTNAISFQPVAGFMKLQSRFYPYLQNAREKLLQNMQSYMRQTQTRPKKTDLHLKTLRHEFVASQASWVTAIWSNGVKKTCTPRLEFKVVFF